MTLILSNDDVTAVLTMPECIEVLEDELFGLTDAWNRLRNSRNHEPLVRIAWIQKDPPAERGVAIRLRHGKAFTALTAGGSTEVYPVDGWVALLAGRYLHLDASFVQTEALENGELRSYLAQFLFSGDDVYKRVSSLSGGEKSRLSLAKIIYEEPQLLALDEPTNHLDIPSREASGSSCAARRSGRPM